MRTVLLMSAAVLAMAGCQKAGVGKGAAASSAPSGTSAAAIPKPKPGLWAQTMSHDGVVTPIGTVKVCIYAATNAQISLLGRRVRDKSHCQRTVNRGLDGSYNVTLICNRGESGTTTTKATLTGDFNSSYKLQADSDVTGAAVGAVNGHHVMEIDATYQGPCPPGMAGGDETLANGRTLNIGKMAAQDSGKP